MTIIGVDSHKSTHTAVSINENGQKKQELTIKNERSEYVLLLNWAREQGSDRAWAVENCGSYGRQLA
jgi:transposase